MTPVAVLLAGAGATWEAGVLAAARRPGSPVQVARRCLDATELLACAALGGHEAAIVAAGLPGLDGELAVRLGQVGVRLLAVVDPGEDAAERRARQLGIIVLRASDGVDALLAAARGAGPANAAPLHHRGATSSAAVPDDPAALLDAPASQQLGDADAGEDPPVDPARSRVVAVWGPPGSPGRSTLAVSLAAAAAALGLETLLIDADTYAPSLDVLLGVADETPGLTGAARRANQGNLDVAALARLCTATDPRQRLLAGLPTPQRWADLRPGAVDRVLDVARGLADLVVVDVGWCLEADEELVYDTLAPRRNGATLEALAAADAVVAVVGADVLGLRRAATAWPDLVDEAAGTPVHLVVNRVRRGTGAGDPVDEVTRALVRAELPEPAVTLPDDPAAHDAAMTLGRAVVDHAPRSPWARAVVALTDALLADLDLEPAGPQPDPARRSLRGFLTRRLTPHRSAA